MVQRNRLIPNTLSLSTTIPLLSSLHISHLKILAQIPKIFLYAERAFITEPPEKQYTTLC